MAIDQMTAFGVCGKEGCINRKFRCMFSINRNKIEINRGSLAATVYSSM